MTRRRRRHRRRLHRAVDGVAAARARRVGRACWRPSCAGTGRAGATAASARRCGRTCRRWSSASAATRAIEVCAGVGRERRGDRRAGARSRASTPGSRRSGYVMASTAPAHDAVIDEILAVAPREPRAARSTQAGVRARCDSPRFRRGLLRARRRDRPARAARARPARRGVRERASIYEHSRVTRAARARRRRDRRDRPAARVRAGAAVLAVNAATRGVPAAAQPRLGHLLAHRPDRARPGRARGARLDRRRVHHRRPHVRALLPHHPRRPDRVRLGRRPARARRAARRPGRGRRRGRGGDPRAPRRRCSRRSRAARSPTRGAARSTSRRAICRRSARSTDAPVHYAFGFTGNGVGPSPPRRPRRSRRWRRGEPTDLARRRPGARSGARRSRSPSRAECWCAAPFYVRNALRKRADGRSADPRGHRRAARARDPRGALTARLVVAPTRVAAP